MMDRLKSLKRIESVQKKMVRLSELRLAAAERACRELVEDKGRLETYVVREGALGEPLARAALKSLHLLERRRETAERLRKAGEVDLLAAKRRELAIEGVKEKAALHARRADDDRELASVVESWFAGRYTHSR